MEETQNGSVRNVKAIGSLIMVASPFGTKLNLMKAARKHMKDNEFITAAQSFSWTYAKSMPQCPHEYIVRCKTADEDLYLAMFRTIEAHGEWGEWNGVPHQYLHPGDGYYYWKMTDDMQESIIINRTKETFIE